MTTPTVAATSIPLAELHSSLSDPLLDTMNFLNEIASRFPDAISFAPGRPYDETFDSTIVAGYLRTYEQYLQRERGLSAEQTGNLLFQYGRTKGHIHELVAKTIQHDEGVSVSPEAVVVTVGAQEGMLLVLRALIRDPNDVLLIASPCYLGITGAARILDVLSEPVPEGSTGVDAATLRVRVAQIRAAGRRPRLLYVIPDFANPSGLRMPISAREELLHAAAELDLLVLEDNPYGLFTRDDTTLPVLKHLDRQRRVIYLGTFAKTCFPGARVGYVIADQRVMAPDGEVRLLADELAKLKSMTTVNTSPLAQAVIGGMLLSNDCRLRAANQGRISNYRARLDRLDTALEKHFPPDLRQRLGIKWDLPDGGFFLAMSVPFAADYDALIRSASEHGVLWTPMSFFYLDNTGDRKLRLSFSYVSLDQIDEGVRRLREFITSQAAM
jgi:(S)-3,5-dihydroxyphenylglycine transaminase